MSEVNRRRFLQLAGATTAFTALSGSIERAAALPANHRTGSIEDVEHIVVLMQENRSFDHYFGRMSGVRGFGDPRPVVTRQDGKPVWYQSDGKKDVLPFRPDHDDLGLAFVQDLPHGWNDGHAAFDGGKYDKWVPSKGSTTMAYLQRGDIPFHYALADSFTICDSYHCSFIGSTDPNRYYLWTGHTGNDGKGGGPVLGNDEAGYSWTTYPERLEKAGVSWKIYQDAGDGLDKAGGWGWIQDAYRGNYGDNSLLYFTQYQNAKPGDALYDKARTGTDAKNGEDYFAQLKADVKADKLPQISWIVAPEAFTEHPNWPANYGAWYVSQVLDALTSNPEVWSKTALFITYDENDGFFDHVVPPFAEEGRSTVEVGTEVFKGDAAGHVPGPYGLGQRVPMIVVSPWSKGGYVCSETLDHTSVIRFMERRFGVHEPNISPWRRAVCGDLTAAFDFSRKDVRPVTLPSTAAYEPADRNRHPDYVPTPPAHPALPRQERGHRPTRPLRYAPSVDAKTGSGALTLTFASGAHAGGAFLVTTPGVTPRSYTTGAGKKISDTFTGASYDLTVHGPAGFLRTFKGETAHTGPEVVARHVGDHVELTFTNKSKDTVELRVTDAYRSRTTTVKLRPKAVLKRTVETSKGHRWYDLTVTSHASSTFLRRFAGHVENGRPGVSDPAIITE
ncbi:phosphocholine-specific phospholipase C [Streptomyces acidiscabies]|uniref:phospholipase C n=1 Tax=Streptomyces acidiscabies TaxID=42234 RepID=A0AAP6BAF2_9ACTN|nr:phospholipase C, phosphocholine-specific [Streptomyces acidiscabies]MBP5935622.1 phospholipase C, phosphocholine-specific [Streptomyces sp. LBUM 1476]MBZ3916489.1 phospholipase C, phosphocholine-specific [Streptomyces acidiscabies]MDX2961138.1 phospholipase C, phosphocholine-specific [Streptomyces acidiscabies]MDX3791845.1 phospholipase C, phosphocholine-specific [Streptomyces acidiscabies]GAQ58993.1 non-hemolytic phospholipase C precursor [Streptomyces acidiscabies]